jgi:hypothetical protein
MGRHDAWIEFLSTCQSLDHWQKSSLISYVSSLNESEDGLILMSHSIINTLSTTNVVFIRTHEVIESYITTLLSNFGRNDILFIAKNALLSACDSILDSSDVLMGKAEVITNKSIICALLIYAFKQKDSYIDQTRVCAALIELVEINFDCFENVVVEISYKSDLDALLGLVDDLLAVESLFGVAIALLKQLEVFFVGEERVGLKYKSLVGKAHGVDWYEIR